MTNQELLRCVRDKILPDAFEVLREYNHLRKLKDDWNMFGGYNPSKEERSRFRMIEETYPDLKAFIEYRMCHRPPILSDRYT